MIMFPKGDLCCSAMLTSARIRQVGVKIVIIISGT